MSNKLSLHDFFGMLIPGCLLVLVLVEKYQNVSLLFNVKDNNIFASSLLILTFGYCIGLVWHMFVDFISKPFRPISLYIYYIISNREESEFNAIPGVNLKDRYYYAYEYVQQYSKSTAIKFVEGQVLLMRNLSLPFALWLCIKLEITQWLCIVILLGLFSVIFMVLRQMTIYRLVFEEYFYLKEVNENHKQKG